MVTPSIGLGWEIAEASIDKYVIRAIEADTGNTYARVLVRGLNPARSFANLFEGRLPWDRDDRPSPFRASYDRQAWAEMATASRKIEVHPPPGVAPFEFTISPNFRQYIGSGSQGACAGGGVAVALRMASDWQMVVDVNGCKLLELRTDLSGDSLSYMVGPRWTPRMSSRWTPRAKLLVGGQAYPREYGSCAAEGGSGVGGIYR